jgi:glycerophosphoryl diester phosphodiesterase
MTAPVPFSAIAANWPYPRWIAHRGAGKLAPENTLAAFRLGASHGYRMFECDAKLSADGVAFLLHDDTLDRTTNGQGIAGQQHWGALSQLDAGGWHSRAYAGETVATLEAVARYCLNNAFCLNIEIKPTPGTDRQTGIAVAQAASRRWSNESTQPPALLTSFQPEALAGAREAAPELPRGLLLDTLWDGWMGVAQQLECAAIVCNHALWNEATLGQATQAGFRTLAYTVNDEWAVERLLAMGIDGVITDRVDLFPPGR